MDVICLILVYQNILHILYTRLDTLEVRIFNSDSVKVFHLVSYSHQCSLVLDSDILVHDSLLVINGSFVAMPVKLCFCVRRMPVVD